MKPEHKAEYDKLGLPWNCGAAGIHQTTISSGRVTNLVAQGAVDSYGAMVFAVKAANQHHALLEQVETLQIMVEQSLRWKLKM